MKQYWVTPWSGSGPCFCHCSWCWCTWGRSKTSSNQLSRVKNIYFDTKINLLWCQGAELHLQVTLDRVVAIIRRGNSPTNRRGRVDTRPSSSRRRTGARARSREGEGEPGERDSDRSLEQWLGHPAGWPTLVVQCHLVTEVTSSHCISI